MVMTVRHALSTSTQIEKTSTSLVAQDHEYNKLCKP